MDVGTGRGMWFTLNHCVLQVCMAKPDPKGVWCEKMGPWKVTDPWSRGPMKGTVTYGRDPEGGILFHICSQGVNVT